MVDRAKKVRRYRRTLKSSKAQLDPGVLKSRRVRQNRGALKSDQSAKDVIKVDVAKVHEAPDTVDVGVEVTLRIGGVEVRAKKRFPRSPPL
jgi:hypothetical protein